ncbi:hypothetical protein [Hansschlegelia beijingensis]|uniref:Uncharacterized protein n=1 Tax=Hansschlegelia beijingensis TaxID=1133344 RepID=A0A7W6GG85_9HYPH|nr:hypothetical protein [Hansschlegelia beijingensis]MBB3974105.1 hypothetical protein [Hansschlegelia beijingensis]
MLNFSDDELRLVGRSLSEVGVDKPIGYLPLYTLEAMGEHGKLLGEDAMRQGLVAVSFGPDECCIKSGAFYVYDREALAKLLEQHAEALSAAHMTADPDKFIAEIAAHWLDVTHPLTPLIAAAFGEHPLT